MPPAKRLYAEGTTVSPEKSQQEIISILRRYGAEGFTFGEDRGFGAVMFRARGRTVRFMLQLEVDDAAVRMTRNHQYRNRAQMDAAKEAEVRRRWRALTMAIKAKLEVVESGIVSFEDEFAMQMMLPDGSTVAEHVMPAIETAYATGELPPLLPMGQHALPRGGSGV